VRSDLGSSGEGWDGMVACSFESPAKAKELFGSEFAATEAREDEKRFRDHGRGVHMLTRPHIVKDL
jgi:hypothetical protein